MDFLGLTTLTLIDDCVKLIEAQTGGCSSTSTAIPLDDPRTYELFTAGTHERPVPVRVGRACATSCSASSPTGSRT